MCCGSSAPNSWSKSIYSEFKMLCFLICFKEKYVVAYSDPAVLYELHWTYLGELEKGSFAYTHACYFLGLVVFCSVTLSIFFFFCAQNCCPFSLMLAQLLADRWHILSYMLFALNMLIWTKIPFWLMNKLFTVWKLIILGYMLFLKNSSCFCCRLIFEFQEHQVGTHEWKLFPVWKKNRY